MCTDGVFKNICSVKWFVMCSSWTQCMLLAPGMVFQDRRLLRSGLLGQHVYYTPLVDEIWAVVPD